MVFMLHGKTHIMKKLLKVEILEKEMSIFTKTLIITTLQIQ